MTTPLALGLAALISVVVASPARADRCTAVAEDGSAPVAIAPGRVFAGPVVEVIDGDSLCVALGPRAGVDWVEVRLGDFSAPELRSPAGRAARSALERIALGQWARCVAGLRTYDRIAARCTINGEALSALLLKAGVVEGGRGVREAGAGAGARSVKPARAPSSGGMSCPELRARGGARRGEPGYRPEWDGDKDGIACEPYRR